MIATPFCDSCAMVQEDIEHIFLDCPTASQGWGSLRARNMDFIQPDLSFTEWFFHHARGKHNDEFWATKFLLTLWHLWKWRCAISFGTMEAIPRDKGQFLLFKFTKVIKVMMDTTEKQTPRPEHDRTSTFIRWSTPPGGGISLNFDGAAKGNPGPAAVGEVLRDH